MPSRKVAAAAAGLSPRPLQQSSVRNNVRYGIVPKDPELARVQEDMRVQNEKLLEGTPFRNGTLVEVDFNGTDIEEVQHKLGGPAKGFIVVDLIGGTSGPITIVRAPTSSLQTGAGRDDTHMSLYATDGCRATLWIWR